MIVNQTEVDLISRKADEISPDETVNSVTEVNFSQRQ